ncbi:MAG: hypothetical protein ABH879_09500 [archaeon]
MIEKRGLGSYVLSGSGHDAANLANRVLEIMAVMQSGPVTYHVGDTIARPAGEVTPEDMSAIGRFWEMMPGRLAIIGRLYQKPAGDYLLQVNGTPEEKQRFDGMFRGCL